MRSTWMMFGVLLAVFSAGVAVGALQQQAAQSRREPQFENDQVRVWKSVVLPNQPLQLHRHDHGRTIVALKGGTMEVVDAKGQTKKKKPWEAGKAYWLDVDPPNEEHADLNRGKEPIEVMVIEMRK